MAEEPGQLERRVPQAEVGEAADVLRPVLGCVAAHPAAQAPFLGVRWLHLDPGLFTSQAWMHWRAPQPSSAQPCPLASSACFVLVFPLVGFEPRGQPRGCGPARAKPSVANLCWGGPSRRKKGQGRGGGCGRRSRVRQAQPCAGSKAGGAGRGRRRRARGGGGTQIRGRQAPPTAQRARGQGTAAWGAAAGHRLAWSATMKLRKTTALRFIIC